MTRILVADSNSERRERLRAALASAAETECAGQARDGQETLALAHSLSPDVVLMDSDLAGWGDGFAAAELLTASGLPLEVILLSDGSGPDDLRRAMRVGAREHLSRSVSPAVLCAAIRAVHTDGLRRRSAEFAGQADPHAQPRILAVCGAKGGIGKTTLAVNLAAALATETGEPTVLLDLYTQFGDAALLLNLTPRRTLADLVRLGPTDLDERSLEDHLERHSCGLRVLAGAGAPLPLDALTPERLDHVLSLLRRGHRYLVLDVPPVLHAATLHALSHAHAALLVANLFDLTTLADTRLWLEALAGPYVAPSAIHLVLNRVSARNRLQILDLERTLGRTAAALIPNDGRRVPASVNAGIPFVLSHPGSRVAQSICALARSFTPLRSPVPASASTSITARWLSRKGPS